MVVPIIVLLLVILAAVLNRWHEDSGRARLVFRPDVLKLKGRGEG